MIGGEPVPGRLAGIHDIRQTAKYRVGEPVAAQIVPSPLDRNITIRHGGNRAFYSVDRDIVQMPEFQRSARTRSVARKRTPP